MPAHKVPLLMRFWQKVDTSGECWLWTGARSGDGYGHIKVEGRMVKAHRVGYRLLSGQRLDDEADLDHLCRTPLCVRWDHLEPVTRATNILRGTAPTADNARKTHCIHGHEFTEDNTYWFRETRACRTCRAEIQRRRRA